MRECDDYWVPGIDFPNPNFSTSLCYRCAPTPDIRTIGEIEMQRSAFVQEKETGCCADMRLRIKCRARVVQTWLWSPDPVAHVW